MKHSREFVSKQVKLSKVYTIVFFCNLGNPVAALCWVWLMNSWFLYFYFIHRYSWGTEYCQYSNNPNPNLRALHIISALWCVHSHISVTKLILTLCDMTFEYLLKLSDFDLRSMIWLQANCIFLLPQICTFLQYTHFNYFFVLK